MVRLMGDVLLMTIFYRSSAAAVLFPCTENRYGGITSTALIWILHSRSSASFRASSKCSECCTDPVQELPASMVCTPIQTGDARREILSQHSMAGRETGDGRR